MVDDIIFQCGDKTAEINVNLGLKLSEIYSFLETTLNVESGHLVLEEPDGNLIPRDDNYFTKLNAVTYLLENKYKTIVLSGNDEATTENILSHFDNLPTSIGIEAPDATDDLDDHHHSIGL